jgi:translation initiation factor 3 subunit H
LKIVKHCHESLPQMVTGSLLGLSTALGVLEITHAFPNPDSKSSNNDEDGAEGHDFQIEMMRMLREVNVDNNCVGWYQSMYLGIYSTSNVLENQLSYQTDLSPNAVVFLYDPMQTTHGNLVLKCLRLTDQCVALKTKDSNAFIEPSKLFEAVPVKLTNPGLARAYLAQQQASSSASRSSTTTPVSLERLDLSTNPYLEKHLEFLCAWVDDLSVEQQKFQYYARQLARDKKNRTTTSTAEVPRRMESLLIANQIQAYVDQMDKFGSAGLGKLYLAGGLQGRDEPNTQGHPSR